MLLQSETAYFITKCDNLLLQSATTCYYKVRQVLLQSASGITKCDGYYKVRQNVSVYMSRIFTDVFRRKIFSLQLLLQSLFLDLQFPRGMGDQVKKSRKFQGVWGVT